MGYCRVNGGSVNMWKNKEVRDVKFVVENEKEFEEGFVEE